MVVEDGACAQILARSHVGKQLVELATGLVTRPRRREGVPGGAALLAHGGTEAVRGVAARGWHAGHGTGSGGPALTAFRAPATRRSAARCQGSLRMPGGRDCRAVALRVARGLEGWAGWLACWAPLVHSLARRTSGPGRRSPARLPYRVSRVCAARRHPRCRASSVHAAARA